MGAYPARDRPAVPVLLWNVALGPSIDSQCRSCLVLLRNGALGGDDIFLKLQSCGRTGYFP